MRINLIAAMANNGVIGKGNAMPWHLPADFAWFKRHTLGHPVLMGRKTFESIGKPLPGRRNVVITRNTDWCKPGVEVAPSLDAALALLNPSDDVFVIGGGDVYAQALPLADRLVITFVDVHIEGDTRFPPWHRERWRETFREHRDADERHAHAMDFAIFERDQKVKL